MQLLIPMAGAGRRFAEAGYTEPKPLIDCGGKTMIQRVLETLPVPSRLIVCHQPDVEPNIPGATSVVVDKPTEGAACTALLALGELDLDEPLMIANCDQLVWTDWDRFLDLHPHADGKIACFISDGDPKWSYVGCGDGGWIYKVREKDPFSELATCGVYYWRKAELFARSALQMIADDDRTNGEFYIAPSYQHLIDAGHNISVHVVKAMLGMGTPGDLEETKRLMCW